MQWLKDNKPMEDPLADRVTTTMVDNKCKLVIQNVIESDSGIYTARALNADGEATCTAQLIVHQCKLQPLIKLNVSLDSSLSDRKNVIDVCRIRTFFRKKIIRR